MGADGPERPRSIMKRSIAESFGKGPCPIPSLAFQLRSRILAVCDPASFCLD